MAMVIATPPPAPSPVTRAPGGGPDTLRRLLADLCTRGPPKVSSSHSNDGPPTQPHTRTHTH